MIRSRGNHSERAGTGEHIRRNADPIGDDAHRRSPGTCIATRPVLFKLVHVCAVYCRFCFRREMVGPGKATALSEAAYRNALGYIREHKEIWEVILTGGDPLMLSPRGWRDHGRPRSIDHVKMFASIPRAGAAPARIDGDMIGACGVEGATTWIAVHANHPRELAARPAPPARGSPMPAFPGEPVGAAAWRQ